MIRSLSRKHLKMNPADWVFSWRGQRDAAYGIWLALIIVGALFALLLTSLRIRVVDPVPWQARKGAVIHVNPQDPIGRTLYFRALEGGPFISRFEPSRWEGSLNLEEAALGPSAWSPPPYQPKLRPLPNGIPVPTVKLATMGVATLPPQRVTREQVTVAGEVMPVPRVYPLSGISFAELPLELPPFAGELDQEMISEAWRFLLQIGPAGEVLECVSLARGDAEDAAAQLKNWLRGMVFQTGDGEKGRWVSVGVGFLNQVDDGADTR